MEEDIITDLRNKLKEVENERLKAAQYGLQLLESQNELQDQLDKCRNEMMTVTEVGLRTLCLRMSLAVEDWFCLASVLFSEELILVGPHDC
jgi:hypothetical protein